MQLLNGVNRYDTSFNTIIIDNSHDPKNDDGHTLDVDSPIHV